MKSKAKPLVKLSDDSDLQVIKKTASQDSKVEEIGARTESPEEELGELSTMAMLTILWLLPTNIFEEWMAKDWMSPIYGFFKPHPAIEVIEGHRCHKFQCAAPLCRGNGVRPRIVRRYLDKADQNSTSNMHRHAKNCWGDENISKALEAKGALSIDEVRKSLVHAELKYGSIMASFERKGKGNVTFST